MVRQFYCIVIYRASIETRVRIILGLIRIRILWSKSIVVVSLYYLNQKKSEYVSLFKEWIVEKSEIRVNLEWTFVLFTQFGVTSGITNP